MNIWMAYIKQIYTAFIWVSGLKLMVPRWLQLCYFAEGHSHLGPIVLPRALSWPYIFVHYGYFVIDFTIFVNYQLEWTRLESQIPCNKQIINKH